MAKRSQLDRAIDALDTEIAVLQAAKQRLNQQRFEQQKNKAARKPRVVQKDRSSEPLGARILNA